jgi:pimeloyl-ACP methyl ester carboxylesterase
LASQVGTNNVARDIDVFRAALGERELSYLGFSYGTILGASYADLFPGRVRAMVLDANTPPGWFGDNLLELDTEGGAGAEAALARLDRLCRDASDCPLRTAGVRATYDRIVARLDANPVPAPGGYITGLSVLSVVFGALYSEQFGWAALPRFLARVDGGDLRGLPAFPLEDGESASIPGTFAITCSDTTTRRGGLDTLPLQDAAYAATPRFGGANFGIAPALCSAWPRPPVDALDDLRTRRPVVLIGNDFDPATPMTWSRNMSAALGAKARLVRYQGGGHTIYGSGSACIDGAIERYFRDLVAPEAGLTCPALPLSFGPSARAAAGLTMSQAVQQVAPDRPALPRRK